MAWFEISRTLQSDQAVLRLTAMLSQEAFKSRNAFSRRVCEEFAFFDCVGRPQVATCTKVLVDLATKVPALALPVPCGPRIDHSPRLLPEAVESPTAVPDHPAHFRHFTVKLVESRDDKDTWNTLMAFEHPQGLTTFVGRQVRSLLISEQGWLGAAGFSASA